MIVLAGGDIVLPDRILTSGSLLIDDGRIVAIESRDRVEPAGATVVDATEQFVVPGFIDVHIHGLEGHDTLDGAGAIAAIAARLPRHGVTAFCPTSVACPPSDLRRMLDEVRDARVAQASGSARVLPAHLESNFVNPEYRGAQPAECLRTPVGAIPEVGAGFPGPSGVEGGRFAAPASEGDFSARDVLDVIERSRADVGIVTLAPELPGGLDLVRSLVAYGHFVSIGHSGATFEEANAAVDAGARQATHLFNRMPPMAHRAPGLVGAVLARDEVCAELICDGFHVHPVMCGVAIGAKRTTRVMAITDGTSGSGLPIGTTTRQGGRTITVGESAAFLEDGTLAGSTLSMDGAFRTLVNQVDCSVAAAAILCSTTPARELGLTGFGVIATGAVADIVLLDRGLRVTRTFIGGQKVYGPA
jgi:N-acetylglucosamine-6-phosphate deacetylase